MGMRREEKGRKQKEYGPKCIRNEKRHKKNVMLQSPCVVMSVNCSVNDISNVRCHGWDMGSVKERRITTLFNVMKER